MISPLQQFIRSILSPIEYVFNKCFGDRLNPFHHLGALAFYFFWIVGISGLYLYIFFETSILGAYGSIEYLSKEQWYLGGVMRSLHRYCSDAMGITVTAHLLREFSLGRYNGIRWFSWVSGVPLLWLLFAAAIGGYWLVWDELAQYIAITTTEWLDWLPNFSDPMARNFLDNQSVSDRLFSFLVFFHIGISLFMLLAMLIHIKRLANAKSTPPKELALGTLSAFIALSLIQPAMSAGPADLSRTQQDIPLDWIFLNIYPLIDLWGPGLVWGLLTALTGLLFLAPWLVPRRAIAVAQVDPDHCGGCGWCEIDCPYEAIELVAHPVKDKLRMAVVNPDLCISCGICTGSCPSATPFQHVDELVSGIEIPSFSVDELKRKTLAAVRPLNSSPALKDQHSILVYGCDHGARLEKITLPNVTCISLPCIGFLPPSFVDFLLKENLVEGIVLTGCCGDDCYFRRGNQWTEERFAGLRFPHVRTQTAKEQQRVKIHWAGPLQLKELEREITKVQNELAPLEKTIVVKSLANDVGISNDFK